METDTNGTDDVADVTTLAEIMAAETIDDLRGSGANDRQITEAMLTCMAGMLDADLGDVAAEIAYEIDLSELAPVATNFTRDQGGSLVITISPEVLDEAGFTRGGGDKVRQLAGDGEIGLLLAEKAGDRDE